MLVCPLCRIALAKGEAICPRDGQIPVAREPFAVPPSVAARFAIVEPYADGDAGTLYLADDKQTGRRGLLKLLRGATAWTVSERSRLKRELLKQASLTHPGLVVPLATGEAENVVWLFREWIDGVSLAVKLARTGALATPEALAIAAQIASALDELHRAGLLQRDLSAGHVIVQQQPSGFPKVSVIDAGIAMRIASSSVFEITGKAGYVSPEHASGKLVSFRSDLYSLGCLMHEMVSGAPIFRGSTEQVLEAQRAQSPPALQVSMPTGVSALIAQLTLKEPRDRPFSAQQVRRALEPFLPEDASTARREPTASFGVEHVSKPPPAAARGSGTLRPPTQQKRTLVGFQIPKPGAAPAEGTQELTPLDLATAEKVLSAPPRGDATVALGDADLATNGAPPKFRRDADPTMPLSPTDLVAARPQPRPPGAPGATSRPRSHPPPAPPSARPPPPPSPFATPPLGALPQAQAQPTSQAGELDYDDLAETTALEKEEAHKLLPPAGMMQPGNRAVPVAFATTAPAVQAPTAVDQIAYAKTSPAGMPAVDAPAVTGTPSPFTATDRAPSRTVAAVMSTGQPPVATAATVPAPAGPIEDDIEVPGLRPSRTPLFVLAGVVAFCMMSTAAGLVGSFVWARFLAPADQPAAVATAAPLQPAPPPVVAPVSAPTPPPVAPAIAAPAIAAPGIAAPGIAAPGVVAPAPTPAPAPVVAPAPAPAPVVAPSPAPAPRATTPAAAPVPAPRATTAPAPAPRASSSTASPPASSGTPRIAAGIRPGATTPAPAPAPASGGGGGGGAQTFESLRDEARRQFGQHHYAEAARAYEQAARIRPRDAATWAGLGAARLAGGDSRGAIQAYGQALSIDGDNARYHVSMGRALVAAGDRARARQAFSRALVLDPNNREARTQLDRL